VTITAVVDPAVAVVRAPHDIGAANDTADHASDDCAWRTSNDGSRARANGNAFQRSGLGHDRHRRQHQCEQSSLERRTHEKSPWLASIAVSKNREFRWKTRRFMRYSLDLSRQRLYSRIVPGPAINIYASKYLRQGCFYSIFFSFYLPII
jgi:hypothetical protein